MSGIAKECLQCKETFITRTISSARWQKYCSTCWSERQQTNAESSIKRQQTHMFESLNLRMQKIEERSQHIDVLISAEISNALASLSNNELFDSVHDAMQKTIDEKIQQIDAENKKFRTKIQKQLVVLNNKLVKIMKEMEK